jgi:hypothetical protein
MAFGEHFLNVSTKRRAIVRCRAKVGSELTQDAEVWRKDLVDPLVIQHQGRVVR